MKNFLNRRKSLTFFGRAAHRMLALRCALLAWHARSHDLHKAIARTLGKSLWRAYLATITYNAKADELVARYRV
jgi:hypothetical protein